MIKKIEFTDLNKVQIIADQKKLGFRLMEEQRHFDGNFLIFTDEPPEVVLNVKAEIADIKERLSNLELKAVRV